MIEQRYKNIVWDWNGTLLDDVDTGVRTLADMLARRGLCPLSLEEYKAQFGSVSQPIFSNPKLVTIKFKIPSSA